MKPHLMLKKQIFAFQGVKLIRVVGLEYTDTQTYFVTNNAADCQKAPTDLSKLKSNNALNFACQVWPARMNNID